MRLHKCHLSHISINPFIVKFLRFFKTDFIGIVALPFYLISNVSREPLLSVLKVIAMLFLTKYNWLKSVTDLFVWRLVSSRPIVLHHEAGTGVSADQEGGGGVGAAVGDLIHKWLG